MKEGEQKGRVVKGRLKNRGKENINIIDTSDMKKLVNDSIYHGTILCTSLYYFDSYLEIFLLLIIKIVPFFKTYFIHPKAKI